MTLHMVWQVYGLPDGPGTKARPYTTSLGMLTYAVRYMLTCDSVPPDTANGRAPFQTQIPTKNPSLVLVANEMDSSFIEPVRQVFNAFGPNGQDGTIPGFIHLCRARLAMLTPEFGPGTVNLDALDDIDVSDLPPIFGAYKAEYYSIFQYHRAFTPSRYLAGAAPLGPGGSVSNTWNLPLLNDLYEIFEDDPNNAANKLERWWWHASFTQGLEAAERLSPQT